jgi:hypothetical protein
MTPSMSGHMIATWNAFVLQTFGESMLGADHATGPGTVGYVLPATFEHAWIWLATSSERLNVARPGQREPSVRRDQPDAEDAVECETSVTVVTCFFLQDQELTPSRIRTRSEMCRAALNPFKRRNPFPASQELDTDRPDPRLSKWPVLRTALNRSGRRPSARNGSR